MLIQYSTWMYAFGPYSKHFKVQMSCKSTFRKSFTLVNTYTYGNVVQLFLYSRYIFGTPTPPSHAHTNMHTTQWICGHEWVFFPLWWSKVNILLLIHLLRVYTFGLMYCVRLDNCFIIRLDHMEQGMELEILHDQYNVTQSLQLENMWI